jgi:hypothetical protein
MHPSCVSCSVARRRVALTHAQPLSARPPIASALARGSRSWSWEFPIRERWRLAASCTRGQCGWGCRSLTRVNAEKQISQNRFGALLPHAGDKPSRVSPQCCAAATTEFGSLEASLQACRRARYAQSKLRHEKVGRVPAQGGAETCSSMPV